MSAERCQVLLSALFEYSCQPEFKEQMEIARELFSIATGKVNDEDPFYESRMAVFQEYFVFDYRLSSIFSGATILETFLLNAQRQLGAVDLFDYEQLRSERRSIFRVEKEKGDGLIVCDLLSQRDIMVLPLPEYSFTGFDPDRVFEGRIVNFNGKIYFTGAFIFHPSEVVDLIEDHIKDFLARRTQDRCQHILDWRAELKRRHELLTTVAEQKRLLEQTEKKKAVEILNVSKNLAQVAQVVGSGDLVMALGVPEKVSPFVPETPFYDATALMDLLAYSELRCYRYKHIDPTKLYSFGKEQFPLSVPPKDSPVSEDVVAEANEITAQASSS